MRFSLSLSLKEVWLNFNSCTVSDTGVQAVAQALQGLVQLTDVTASKSTGGS